MVTQKIMALVIYAVLAAFAFLKPDTKPGKVGKWFFMALPFVHLLELVFVYDLLQKAEGSLVHHLVQTMIFGYVHWMPIYESIQ